ncbi:hypothetical protein CR513_04614, partial [Mucuna pruriens]
MGEVILASQEKASSTKEVINIVGTGGVTRSGWKDLTPKEKGSATKNPKEITMGKEATTFLKLICHSGYELLDQMNKTPAQFSLLSLLINSERHRNLLLIILNKAHVAQEITIEKFRGIMNNITTNSHLSFSEEEVSAEGRGHNQPFHIAVKCGNYMIARVLIDNRSSFNVMPKITLDKL